jgi:putative nucleotidyltransferase with HDIG domain
MKKTRLKSNFFGPTVGSAIALIAMTLLVIVSAVLVPMLLSKKTNLLTDDIKSRYQVGSLADQDVVASETFHYLDEIATQQAIEEASRSIKPYFNRSSLESLRMLTLIDTLFDSHMYKEHEHLQIIIQSLDQEQQRQLYELISVVVNTYIQQGMYVAEQIQQVQHEGYQSILVQTYGASNQYKEQQLAEILPLQAAVQQAELLVSHTANMLNLDVNSVAYDILKVVLQPNIFYSQSFTDQQRSLAMADVEPVIIKVEKGEYILSQDFVISERDVASLQAMKLVATSYSLGEMIARIIFVVIVTIGSLYVLYSIFCHSKRLYQYTMIFLVGIGMSQILLFVILSQVMGRGFISYDPFLPLFLFPFLFSLMTNRKWAGMVSASLLGSYAMLLTSSNEFTLFFILGISFTGIFSMRFVTRRLDMVFQWILGIASGLFLVILNNLFNGYGFSYTLQSVIAISANLSISYVAVSLLLPLIEYIGNLPTPFALRELAYGDLPVLRRLSQVAIGTYNHTMAVADLAYQAAKEIGADALLARVGALYHDIGKQENPDYFIENQTGDNKHDDLKASLSVAIIKSHVKIGIEKAREARLPIEVIDIVGEHHGNDVIAIFLKEAQKTAEDEGNHSEVKQEDYSYNGIIPQSPESAIVMLADGVEAASRTVRKPSVKNYEKIINAIVMGKIERKQLVDSRLSLTDIDRISKLFVQMLMGRHHRRLEYPHQENES